MATEDGGRPVVIGTTAGKALFDALSRRFNNSLSRNTPLEVPVPYANVISDATERGSQRNHSMPILRSEL
jgi:hypothetical protein